MYILCPFPLQNFWIFLFFQLPTQHALRKCFFEEEREEKVASRFDTINIIYAAFVRILRWCFPFTDVTLNSIQFSVPLTFSLTLNVIFVEYAFSFPHSRNRCLAKTSKHRTA